MKKKVILISGLSGAGKTSVSNILEDLGYLCIDQFPSKLIKPLLDLIENDESAKYERVGITVPLMDLEDYFDVLDNLHIDSKLILLDADQRVLLNRYKFTRRIHPLLVGNVADTLEEAIGIEKEVIAKYEEKFEVIDTTNLGQSELRQIVESMISAESRDKFTISFESFGFKNGIASDADLVFDVRFLDNPFYFEELKHKTGNDKEVYDFVMSKERTKEYLNYLLSYLDYSFKMYTREGKRHLTVAVGCTGGQHRSASLVNYLYDHYKEQYNCLKKHRDIK
ncbi:MAG: RNase adapter RapZ [Firmicutes bacterium]|nr:RNase adapter RapZ [Bacillota bacterium]MDY3091639.1 RNase adapter RapZ [Erysipelotrichaceae bacterium]